MEGNMVSERTAQIAEEQWEAYCKLYPVAKEAYGEELPKGLWQVLINVEYLISATGGSLHSRQVIAGLIVTWALANQARAISSGASGGLV